MIDNPRIKNFSGFVFLFEGGAAIKTSRRIKESEFPKTLEHLQNVLFPILGLDPIKMGQDYVVIGSIGKKKEADDSSGDLDIGYDNSLVSRNFGIPPKETSSYIYDELKNKLPEILDFDPEINLLKGLNIVSIGWPIEGDVNKGIVQVDLIPISDINWAKFIYYSPNYKIAESKYKSAHRNWLFSAILSAKKRILDRDDSGEVLDFDSPVLILSDGLFWHQKSYRGKIKSRLKNPQKISGSERFITRDPQEFIDFVLGPGYSPEEVKTFEDVWKIVCSPEFELYSELPVIKDKFLEYMKRTGLEVPRELNEIPS